MSAEAIIDLWALTGGPAVVGGQTARLLEPGGSQLQAQDLQLLQTMLVPARDGGPVVVVTAPGSALNPGRWYPRRVEASLERLMDTALVLEADGAEQTLALVESMGWSESNKPGFVQVTLGDGMVELFRQKRLRAWEGKMPDLYLRVHLPGTEPPLRRDKQRR